MQRGKTATIAMSALLMSAFSVPAMAYAAESPSMVTDGPVAVTTESGGEATLQIQYAGNQGSLVIAPASEVATNVPDGVTPFATWEVTESEKGALVDSEGKIPGGLLLSFDFGTAYAGYSATVYIDHESGTDEIRNETVSDSGLASINIDRLSLFSVVLEEPAAQEEEADEEEEAADTTKKDGTTESAAAKADDSTAKKVDTGTTAPKTGTPAAPAALMVSALCLGGAAACLLRTRKED